MAKKSNSNNGTTMDSKKAKVEPKTTAISYADSLNVVKAIAAENKLTCKAGIGSRENSVILNRGTQRICRIQLRKTRDAVTVVTSDGTRAIVKVADIKKHIAALIAARDSKKTETAKKTGKNNKKEEA